MKIFKRILLISFVLSVIVGINIYLRSNNLLFFASGTQLKAFINTTWEMSPKEVVRANSVTLIPAKSGLFDLLVGYPKVIRMERYKLFDQKERIALWGYETKVQYALFDDKLFGYQLDLHGFSSPEINEEIKLALTERYGKGYSIEDSGGSMRWETDSEDVSYIILKSIDNTYSPILTISYKPMFFQIDEISRKEHKKLF